jgi:hypothetical protein
VRVRRVTYEATVGNVTKSFATQAEAVRWATTYPATFKKKLERVVVITERTEL